MRCRDVRPMLVAFADDEVSRSGRALIREHLATCRSCRRLAAQLDAATPRAALIVPAATQARLEATVTYTHLSTLAAARPVEQRSRRHAAWLEQKLPVSRATLLAYAGILVVALGWGFAQQARVTTVPEPVAAAPSLPAGQFRPASWSPPPGADETSRAP